MRFSAYSWQTFCETLEARPLVAATPDYERALAEARAALGEAAFAAACAEGRAMSLDEVREAGAWGGTVL